MRPGVLSARALNRALLARQMLLERRSVAAVATVEHLVGMSRRPRADRARIIPAGRRIPLPPGDGASRGTILVDGMLAGEWRIRRDGGRATLTAAPFDPLAGSQRSDLEAEGTRLLAFTAAGLDPTIVVLAPTP